MWIRRFFASSGFWIVAVYVLFYLFTLIGFLWLLSLVLGSEIENSVKADIRQEYTQIISSPDDLANIIRELSSSARSDKNLYILTDSSGTVLTSNYTLSVPLQEGWFHLPKIDDNRPDSKALSKMDLTLHSMASHDDGYVGWAAIEGDYMLFVGQSLERIANTKQTVFRLALIIVPFALFIATLVGIIFSRITTRRIELINQQCRAIRQQGDVSLRIPNEKPDDEYGLLIANINAMLETIDQSIQNVQSVSDDVAHDLRTPLTRIKYGLETGLNKPQATAKELREILDTAVSETDRVLETFSAILRISQLQTGRRKARFKTFDLSSLVETVAEAYEPTAEERGHIIETHLPDAPSFLNGDKDMIGQLLSNMIENCFEHAGSNLTISLGLAGTQDQVEMTVADTGTGISDADIPRIFDKFYRADKSRSDVGNGLGLAMVKAVTDLHGGHVQVESGTGGTNFVVTLPRGDISGR